MIEERPWFWIIAGPNGSGKSTLYENGDLQKDGRSVWIVNPDLLARRIAAQESQPLPEANVLAVQRIEDWLESSIRVHKSVGVETVLSTDKYRRLVTLAKSLGYEIRLLYVLLDSPEANCQRVELRVRKGGHFVAPEKVVSRYWRSLEQLPWFLEAADLAWIYDNSGAEPQLIGVKEGEALSLYPTKIMHLRKALDPAPEGDQPA